MINSSSAEKTFEEVRLRRFEDNICEKKCPKDCDRDPERVKECFHMDPYEFQDFIHGGVDYSREEFEEEMRRIEKEQKLSKIRGELSI